MKYGLGIEGPSGPTGPAGTSVDSKTIEEIMEHLLKREEAFFSKLEVKRKRIGFLMRFGFGAYMAFIFYLLVLR